ncbi:DUF222 domain-containing protein [Leifsonia sp. NPDC058230]|uniref:DUF222 domain-containing protein n=1 Tax=Leifsonia sp. NPDC058230 TaxID=3346391 RepID=UPI0036D76BCC
MTTTPDPATVLRDALASFSTPGQLGRDELLDLLTVLGDVQAVLDAVKLRAAGELVARSVLAGEENPVTRVGHSSPAVLLAERWQVPVPAARHYCVVGDATAPRVSLAGEVLPATYPALAESVATPLASSNGAVGWVSVEQAAVIVRELGKAAPACAASDLAAGERVLVEHAPSLTVTDLRALAGQVRDRLDQDGILPRDHRQRQRRSLTISTTSDGMTHLDWYLDPESAGYVITAIDTLVGHELRNVRFHDTNTATATATGDTTGDDVPESRSIAQIRSDTAVDVFRHLATCTATGVNSKPPVTVIVRIPLDTLQSGVGAGKIDGIRTPVSAGTIRRMAADAQLIPTILGTHSEVLDLGRSHRLFTRAQKLALAERDGGCAWTGCPHPPAYTEAHHIRWWDNHHGPTDLDNGILLCSRHHHRVHDDRWGIEVHENVPYFTPPAHIDPHRRPRAGGRIRLPGAA